MQLLCADHILHEDDDLLVLSKPPGLLSQPSLDPARRYLAAEAAALLQQLHDLDEPPYLAIHHRLDRDTSGVIVLARSKRANKPLMQAFKQRLAKKTYLALCSGQPRTSPHFEIENHLSPQKRQDGGKKGPSPQVAVFSGGDYAQTSFEILDSNASKEIHLVQANPTTGRRHQIRAHLAEAHLPILADTLYGGSTHVANTPIERVMLHAYRLEIPHPISGEVMVFDAPLPPDFEALLTHCGLSIEIDAKS